MRQAIRVAKAGLGATYPNPCVGAVVWRGSTVLGAGRSAATGGPHAEVTALRRAGAKARGATLSVTLEPCSHHGRTGPCTDAIIAAGIRRVAVGIRDPAAHVGGRGIAKLRRAGIDVELGVLAEACASLHEHYLRHARTGVPFVTLKAATSLDGRIATASGHSQWITSEPARRQGHRLRAEHHAIAVGAATVMADDPRLDVRLVRGTDPDIVVFDPRLRVTGGSFRAVRPGTLVLHTAAASARARARLAKTGATALQVAADRGGGIAIAKALRALGRRDIRSLLVEGGGRLCGAFVAAQAWQRLYLFQAPLLLGDGRSMIAGIDFGTVDAAPRLRIESRRTLGPDTLTIAVLDGAPPPGSR